MDFRVQVKSPGDPLSSGSFAVLHLFYLPAILKLLLSLFLKYCHYVGLCTKGGYLNSTPILPPSEHLSTVQLV